jgi:hypothetical protein
LALIASHSACAIAPLWSSCLRVDPALRGGRHADIDEHHYWMLFVAGLAKGGVVCHGRADLDSPVDSKQIPTHTHARTVLSGCAIRIGMRAA